MKIGVFCTVIPQSMGAIVGTPLRYEGYGATEFEAMKALDQLCHYNHDYLSVRTKTAESGKVHFFCGTVNEKSALLYLSSAVCTGQHIPHTRGSTQSPCLLYFSSSRLAALICLNEWQVRGHSSLV